MNEGMFPGLAPGATFDLRVDEHGLSYDVLKTTDRQRIRERLDRERPWLVVGSPPCVDWGIFNQNLDLRRMTESEVRRRMVIAEVQLRFACEVYTTQLKRGAHFLHEHPQAAASWDHPRV